MLASYQKYLLPNINKWFASHPHCIHNEYLETRSYHKSQSATNCRRSQDHIKSCATPWTEFILGPALVHGTL